MKPRYYRVTTFTGFGVCAQCGREIADNLRVCLDGTRFHQACWTRLLEWRQPGTGYLVSLAEGHRRLLGITPDATQVYDLLREWMPK